MGHTESSFTETSELLKPAHSGLAVMCLSKERKRKRKTHQGIREVVKGGRTRLNNGKHYNVQGARLSHLGPLSQPLAHTEHVFLSSEGLYALSACQFRSSCCFEHASV